MKTVAVLSRWITLLSLVLVAASCSEDSTTGTDDSPPSVSISSPADQETVAIPLTIEAEASDDHGEIDRVEFFADGVSLGFDTTHPYQRTYSPSINHNSGEVVADTLTAVATDDAGNFATSAAVIVFLDTTPPENVLITSPSDGAVLEGPVTITVTAEDNLGIARVEFYVDNGELLGSVEEPPYSLDWNVGAWADGGEHDLIVVARDGSGNFSEAAIRITVSTLAAPPQIQILAPSDESTIMEETFNIQVSVTDDDAVVAVRYTLDGELLGESTEAPYSLQWETLFWADGEDHVLEAEAEDERGNIGFAEPVTVTLSTEAGLDLLEPADDSIFAAAGVRTLSWDSFASAVLYEYQVALDQDFEEILTSGSQAGSSIEVSFDESRWYYWRARAQNGAGRWSQWSRAWGLHIGTIFSKHYGASEPDAAYCSRETQNGSFVTTGVYADDIVLNEDLWLQLSDAEGTQLWSHRIGDSHDFERGYSVRETANDGYVVVGALQVVEAGIPEDWDLLLLETDGSGSVLWQTVYGGSGTEEGFAVQVLPDGYLVAGFTDSFGAGGRDAWLLRTDAAGDTLWTRTYGGALGEEARSLEATGDGGFIMAGYTESFDTSDEDCWVLKIDAQGEVDWTYRSGGAMDDWAQFARPTSDGGCIIAGATLSYGAGESDGMLIKLGANGVEQWIQVMGGHRADGFNSVALTSSGGYIAAGYRTAPFAGQADLWLLGIASGGATRFDQVYVLDEDDRAHSIESCADGGSIIAGESSSFSAAQADIWIIKADAYGQTLLAGN